MLRKTLLIVSMIVMAMLAAGCSPDPIPDQIPGPTFPRPPNRLRQRSRLIPNLNRSQSRQRKQSKRPPKRPSEG